MLVAGAVTPETEPGKLQYTSLEMELLLRPEVGGLYPLYFA